jgi:hypothetical protein
LKHPQQAISRFKERTINFSILQYENTVLKQNIIKNGNGSYQPDELDIINMIGKTVSFIRRFKMILGGCLLAGLAFGIYLYFTSPPQFTTRLIVHSMFLSNQEDIEIVDNWKELLGKKEKVQLTNLMNSNLKIIEKLSEISAEEILKTYAVNNPNGFIINVTVKDNSILDELQKGIVYGLNNSPYVKEKIETKKARDRELIKKTSDEITKLNTTKQTVDSLMQTNQSNTPVMLDISRISAQVIELNEKLFNYQEELKFLSGVQVLENFNKGKLRRNGLLKFSFMGVASGLFIGYLISLFLFVRIKLKTANSVL